MALLDTIITVINFRGLGTVSDTDQGLQKGTLNGLKKWPALIGSVP